VHLADCNIVPCATYVVEAISEYGCARSAPLVLTTTHVWGDIVGPFNSTTGAYPPADGITNFIDIAAIVECFRELPTAPPRSWCDIDANRPSQGNSLPINFGDVVTVIGAFRNLTYPYSGPAAPDACAGVP
jgi:hypothetical protein